VLAALMLVVSRPAIMGTFVAPPSLKLFGWLTTAAMAAAAVAMAFTPQ
jgi:Mn2+/Fe2+ NRAMP family transporter